MAVVTVSSADFRQNMKRVVDAMNREGTAVTVIRNSKPWFKIEPIVEREPSDDMLCALEEARAMRNNPNAKTYDSPQDVFAALGI